MRKFFAALTVAAVAFASASTYAADKAEKPKADPEAAFKRMDKDSDGSLTEAEFLGKAEGDMATKKKELFGKLDANKDGKVSLDEFKARGKKAK